MIGVESNIFRWKVFNYLSYSIALPNTGFLGFVSSSTTLINSISHLYYG